MKRFELGLLAFGAVILVGGVAGAQSVSTPLTQNLVNNVPGVPFMGSPGASNAGVFTTWAYIQSVLKFDVTDSTLDCGIVSAGPSTTPIACSTAGTNAPNATAQIKVYANANWSITLENGSSYSATAEQNISRLVAPAGYDGNFLIHLAAANAQNSGADATVTQPPNPGATVTISATYDQSNSLTNDPDKVDNADNFGSYLGAFYVILHEAT